MFIYASGMPILYIVQNYAFIKSPERTQNAFSNSKVQVYQGTKQL